MQLELTGVVEDGLPPASWLPANPRQGLEVQLGTSLQIVLRVFTRSGQRVALAGATLTLSVTPNAFTAAPLVKKTGAPAPELGPNAATFSFAPPDLRILGPGQWAFDVWLDQAGTRNPVIPTSVLTVLPSAMLPVNG